MKDLFVSNKVHNTIKMKHEISLEIAHIHQTLIDKIYPISSDLLDINFSLISGNIRSFYV